MAALSLQFNLIKSEERKRAVLLQGITPLSPDGTYALQEKTLQRSETFLVKSERCLVIMGNSGRIIHATVTPYVGLVAGTPFEIDFKDLLVYSFKSDVTLEFPTDDPVSLPIQMKIITA